LCAKIGMVFLVDLFKLHRLCAAPRNFPEI
jgi:hypothetical protein